MTTNKPEVNRYNITVDKYDHPVPYETEHGQWVRYSSYKALQAECEHLKAGVAGLSNPETVLVNMLRGTVAIPDIRSWSKLFGEVLNDEDERLLEIARLRSECEQLRKDAERSRAAFCAVIEYMLGDGRREDPLEFLEYWTEGDFESVKEGWPEAPAAIYYADAMADHDAIDAAIQENP